MFRQVESSEEMKTIFEKLNRSEDAYTLPVRGMLQFVMLGKIPTGKVYINDANSTIAVMHEFSEYSQLDGDTATIYATDINSFVLFFKFLSEKRLWIRGQRGLMLVYVRTDFVESVKLILKDVPCDNSPSMQLRCDPPKEVHSSLPSGFKLTVGKRTDAEAVAKAWVPFAPDKVKMFEWYIEQFPSAFIRDANDQPVAWEVTYSCGSGGALYVRPDLRRKHFGSIVDLEVSRYHEKILPCPRYGTISHQNTVSVLFVEKITSWRQRIDAPSCSVLVFGYFKNSTSKL